MKCDHWIDLREEPVHKVEVTKSLYCGPEDGVDMRLETESCAVTTIVDEDVLSRIMEAVVEYMTEEQRRERIRELGGIPVQTAEEVATSEGIRAAG